MKIEEFIKKYNESEDKNACVQSIIKNTYIPFEKKVAMINKCISSNITDTKLITMNTPRTYVEYTISCLLLYTELEIDMSIPLKTYNTLQEHGLVDAIIVELQNCADWREYQVVYKMASNDFRDNLLSVRGFIQNQIAKIANICNTQLKELNKSLKEFDKDDLKFLIKSLR